MVYISILDLHFPDYAAVFSVATLLRLIGLWTTYKILVAIYNISPLHPLSKFPGTKLARMTLCYEAWFDLVKTGRYTREIRKMHKKYGPIVRISPSELHCNDPSFIDEIYAVGGRKRNKSPHTCQSLVPPMDRTGFGTVDHDLHRLRRSPMARHFSRQHLLLFEPEILAKLQYLCDKLLTCKGQKAFDITMAYSCFTTDVISAYSFGEPLGMLTQEDWEPNWRRPTYSFLKTTFAFRFMPLLKKLVIAGNFFASRGWMGPDIKILMNTLDIRIPELVSKSLSAGISTDQKTIFQDILDSKSLPGSDKVLPRLSAEGMALLNAGTETTAWSLSVITFYVLSQPGVLSQLTAELEERFTGDRHLCWTELEKLPYLGGVILEGLRLSYGVSGRTPRTASEEDLVYRGNSIEKRQVEYTIPKGWPVGMSSAVMHHNEEIFPNSEAFAPERWYDRDGNRNKKLEQCLLSFSRGSRQCLGINVAHCELYLAVAFLTLRVFPRMDLFEATEDDVKYDHDLLVPMVKKGSRGVRVVVEACAGAEF